MPTKPPFPDNSQTPFEAPELSRLYREGQPTEPPSHLDELIIAEAHRATSSSVPVRPRAPWVAPLALAAALVLSVTVVLFISREEVEPIRTAPTATPQAKVTAPAVSAPTPPTELATPQRALPETKQLATRESESVKYETVLKKSAGEPASSPATPYRAETAVPAASLATSDQAEHTRAAGVVAQGFADVIAVAVQGRPGAYQMAVTVKSPDTGCGQYADWWEVLSPHRKLLYRRVLDHSHVGEQPFLRVGGPVHIQPDTVVWIRAHMHPAGYGGSAFKGSVASGFQKTLLPSTFAGGLAREAPLPSSCDF